MKKIIKEINKLGEKLFDEISNIISDNTLDNALVEIEINPSDKQVTIKI